MSVEPLAVIPVARQVQWNGISGPVVSGWIDSLQATAHYGALFSADPFSITPPSSVEVGGALYSRQDATGLWDRIGLSVIRLNTALVWRNLAPGTSIAAVGFMDSPFGTMGMLHRAMLDDAVSFPAGGTWVLPAGEYSAGIDL